MHKFCCVVNIFKFLEVFLKKPLIISQVCRNCFTLWYLLRHIKVFLTNRYHFAVRLFSYRSQMTSKCGKNKKVAHEPLGEWVTDVMMMMMAKWNLFVSYNNRKF